MEIFISYRRGGADSPNAGRIHDFLSSLGYEVFYDGDESKNPTGAQFPEVIKESVRQCKVIVAIFGGSWVAQSDRLVNEDDWVREELLYADPTQGRRLIPIYLGTQPKEISGRLPPELQFIETINSHFIWPHFENQQKKALHLKLQELLPASGRCGSVVDLPRLELLCDRVREETCFRTALQTFTSQGRPGGWLLFGQTDQGQHAIFNRLESFTMRQGSFGQKYPLPKVFMLQLGEFSPASLDEIRSHILSRAADDLGEASVDSFYDLYEKLAKRRASLGFFYSVVSVKSAKEAKAWEQCFITLLSQFPSIDAISPPIFFALAIAYSDEKKSFLSFLRQANQVEAYFVERFPAHFEVESVSVQTGQHPSYPFVTSRLKSAKRDDVENWCNHKLVKQYIDVSKKDESLKIFADAAEVPMGQLVDHLAVVMQSDSA